MGRLLEKKKMTFTTKHPRFITQLRHREMSLPNIF